MNIKINHSQLKGRLINDPKMNVFNDKKMLQFSFMYNTVQKTDSEGSHANFVDVEIWNKGAEIMQNLLCKGVEVLLHGNFVQKRFTTKDGKKASKFCFYADLVSIIDPLYKPQLVERKEAVELAA